MAERRRQFEFTSVYRKVLERYIGFIEELSGANTRGRSLEEARANLREAARLVLEANRAFAMRDADPDSIIRGPLRIAAE